MHIHLSQLYAILYTLKFTRTREYGIPFGTIHTYVHVLKANYTMYM